MWVGLESRFNTFEAAIDAYNVNLKFAPLVKEACEVPVSVSNPVDHPPNVLAELSFEPCV